MCAGWSLACLHEQDVAQPNTPIVVAPESDPAAELAEQEEEKPRPRAKKGKGRKKKAKPDDEADFEDKPKVRCLHVPVLWRMV